MSGIAFAEADKKEEAQQLEDIVVSAVRESEPLKEKAQTINAVKGEEIKNVRPSHPAEIMNRIPGVWVNVTAGEGHITAIRQPLTTNPVYLFFNILTFSSFCFNCIYKLVNMSIPMWFVVYRLT